jgi:hypothetical protein
MNKHIFAALIVASILLVSLVIAVSSTPAQADTSVEEVAVTQCTGCGNSCTAESNCGLATCGGVNGGSCSCGR